MWGPLGDVREHVRWGIGPVAAREVEEEKERREKAEHDVVYLSVAAGAENKVWDNASPLAAAEQKNKIEYINCHVILPVFVHLVLLFSFPTTQMQSCTAAVQVREEYYETLRSLNPRTIVHNRGGVGEDSDEATGTLRAQWCAKAAGSGRRGMKPSTGMYARQAMYDLRDQVSAGAGAKIGFLGANGEAPPCKFQTLCKALHTMPHDT